MKNNAKTMHDQNNPNDALSTYRVAASSKALPKHVVYLSRNFKDHPSNRAKHFVIYEKGLVLVTEGGTKFDPEN